MGLGENGKSSSIRLEQRGFIFSLPVVDFKQQRVVGLISDAASYSQTLVVTPVIVFRVYPCAPKVESTKNTILFIRN